MKLRLVRSLAHVRADIAFAVVDAFLITMAYLAALVLRFIDEGGVTPRWWESALVALPLIIIVHLIANVAFGTYGHVWEYASIGEALRIVAAAVSAAVTLLVTIVAARLFFDVEGPVPLAVVALGAMLTLGGMGAVRFRSRLFSLKRMARQLASAGGRRTLIVGTGRPAVNLARYGSGNGQPLDVVGFLSPHLMGSNRRLAGRPVVGTLEEVSELVQRLDIDEVIVATSGDGSRLVRRLVDLCLTVDVGLGIIPDVDFFLGTNGRQSVRDIEPRDLLPRAAVTIDLQGLRSIFEGRRVLVTGAGGSIGSELVRQLLDFGPAEVVALDHDETHLHEARVGWDGGDGTTELVLVLCDIRDRSRLGRVLAEHRPEVVFHAAAHKHVPILEAWPEEAVKTNVVGTAYVLEEAQKWGCERFVLISTDKAADPLSMMGASKRAAEMLVQAASARAGSCLYSAVRFGNVLGSRGSVVPTFIGQIQRGGPVTVTDAEMMRYFMTVDEAVQLVLQAAALTEGGEVFVLDMGEPVKIVDLAHRLIRLAGLVPGRDIEVRMVGRRPGEKLSEILSTVPLRPSSHNKISVIDAPTPPNPGTLWDAVESLGKLAEEGDSSAVREALHALARRHWGSEEDIVRLSTTEDVPEWT
ncbi:MAG: polysaccharide biosynthesis protein [Acidimicrobiia bacterium]